LNPSGGVYVAGTTVTVLAQANAGWVFSGWSGDLSGNQNPASIIMNSNKTVVANFELVSSTGVDSKPRIDSINLVSGSVISGLYKLVVSCSDDVGIGKVELYIDGILVATLTGSPYEYVIDSKGLVNGRHEMMVVVYDSVGQLDSEVIEFIVDNVEVTEKLRGRYLLSVSGDGVNDEIDFGGDVEWVKLYDVKGKIVYEAKNKIGLETKLDVGVYIYKAKLKTGGIKVGSIAVVK
ncbi:MAG: Ig-like domain-containing protein, partial [Ignisphaera sp.]